MRRPLLFAALFVLGVLGVLGGCGEDVDFSSAPAVSSFFDAGLNDGPQGFFSDGRAIGPIHRDGAANCSQCNSNGAMCHLASDCCSQRCESGYCLLPGTCEPPGASCTSRDRCCSGRCEPNGPLGALTCAPYCAADGASCDSAESCCSLACNGGQCGNGPICSPAGTSCNVDSDCCGDKCSNGRCVEPPGSCFPSGEACGDEAGVNCCSGTCNTGTGRCDLGFGQCREMSTPCTQTGECCLGTCAYDNVEGVPVCTAACLGDGKNCNSNSDCCDGICSGTPSRCGPSCGP